MRPCDRRQLRDWRFLRALRSLSFSGVGDDVDVLVRRLRMTRSEALRLLEHSEDRGGCDLTSVLDTFRETGFSQRRLRDLLLDKPELLSAKTIQRIHRCQEFFDSVQIGPKQASHILGTQPGLLDPVIGKEMDLRIQFLHKAR